MESWKNFVCKRCGDRFRHLGDLKNDIRDRNIADFIESRLSNFEVMVKMNICYSYGYGDNSFGHENVKWVGDGRGVGGKSPPGVISTPLCEVGGWYPPLMWGRGVISPPHASFLFVKGGGYPPPPRHFFKKNAWSFFLFWKWLFSIADLKAW